MLKVEQVPETELTMALELLSQHVPWQDSLTISLFHLDDSNAEHYEKQAFTRLFAAMAD